MCFFSSFLSDCWEFSKTHPGIVLVLIGVAGEGFEICSKLIFKHWYEKHERAVETWGAIFWAVVVLGLAWEIPEAVKSERGTADLNVLAANIGTTNAQLVADNLVLRSNVVALEARWQWRTIDNEQTKNFIFLVKKMPKLPIRVAVGQYSPPEVLSYAIKIRSLLNQAGFATPASDTNFTHGVWRTAYSDILPPSPNVEFGDDNLKIVTEGIGSGTNYYYREFTNGFWRPVITNNVPQFAVALGVVFTESKITASTLVWSEGFREWLTTNAPVTIIVLEKPN